MDEIFEQASAMLQCKQCPWYKNCTTPVQLTQDDMKQQLRSAMSGIGIPLMPGDQIEKLLAGMASATQNRVLEACPVFIERLRASPTLSQKLKELMQTWWLEEEAPEE